MRTQARTGSRPSSWEVRDDSITSVVRTVSLLQSDVEATTAASGDTRPTLETRTRPVLIFAAQMMARDKNRRPRRVNLVKLKH